MPASGSARFALLCLLAAGALSVPAGEAKGPAWETGPVVGHGFILAREATRTYATGDWSAEALPRVLMLRLRPDWSAGVLIDQDTLRVAAGWIGAAPRFRSVCFGGSIDQLPMFGAAPLFTAPAGPGWADAKAAFADPRPDPIAPQARPGPLPREHARFAGLYRHGPQRVVLAATVGGSRVLESWALEEAGGAGAFARTLTLAPSPAAQAVALCAAPADAKVDGLRARAGDLHLAVTGAPAGAALAAREGRLVLSLPARAAAASLKVLIAGGGDAGAAAFAALAQASAPAEDLAALTRGGGGAPWGQPIETAGRLGSAEGGAPYVVDSLVLPEGNPWRVQVRVAGFDFAADGRSAALSTVDGDVWTVDGLDERLGKLRWRRFASGLNYPLGLRIVDGIVHVVGRDGLWRLHDLDRDGEADWYENLFSDWQVTAAFHAFAFDLHTDPATGEFVFAYSAPVRNNGRDHERMTAHHGCVLRVKPDGSAMSIHATGLRAPNGLGMSPRGEITSGDNEGSWVVTSPIHWLRPGAFASVVPTAQGRETKPPRPLCWVPREACNSSGGQCWITAQAWGPFAGDLVYLSYGKSALFKVLHEEVGGVVQGGVVRIPLPTPLSSSAMRARMNPGDGQLWIGGMRGWQTNAAKPGGLDRIRYTGAAVRMPTRLRVRRGGVAVTYTCDLDTAALATDGAAAAEAGNYPWHSVYGGKPEPLEHGGKGQRTAWKVAGLRALDSRTVLVEIPEIAPAATVNLTLRVKAADGTQLNHTIHHTIHALGAP